MAHKDIRILFEVADRRFEAVGFLNEDEASVDGEEMLRRTAGENGGAIGDDDEMFLREHLEGLLVELRWYYLLATNHRHPDNSRHASYFCPGGGLGWVYLWKWLDSQFGDNFLVLRRCA